MYDIKLNQLKEFILIASGLHDFEMVYKFALKLIKENSQEKFIFKAHPRSKIFFDKYKLPFNAEFSDHIFPNYLQRQNAFTLHIVLLQN